MHQGLSIDLSFSGMRSSNSNRREDHKGINGEAAWIIVTDHFTGINEGVCNTIDMTITPEKKLLIEDVQKAANDCGPCAPTTEWDNSPAIADEQEEDQPFLTDN